MREGKKPLVSFNKIEKEEEIDEYYYYDNSIVQAEIYDEEMADEVARDEFSHEKKDIIFNKYRFKYLKKEKIFFSNNIYYFSPFSFSFPYNYNFRLLFLKNEIKLIALNIINDGCLILGNFENLFKNLPQEKILTPELTAPIKINIFFGYGALFVTIEQSWYKEKKLLLDPLKVELLKRQIQEFKYFLELVENPLEF